MIITTPLPSDVPVTADRIDDVRSWPQRFFGWIPLPYWLTVFVVWELVFLVDYALGLSTPGGHDHTVEFGCLVFFFAMVSGTVIYCSRILSEMYGDVILFIDQPSVEFKAWYRQQLRNGYEGPIPIVFGVAFAVFESVTAGPIIRQFTPPGTALYILRMVYEVVGFFFLGVGVWALLNVVRIPILLTRYKIKVSLTQVSGRGLQALGSSYFSMSLCIILTFVPLVVAVIISPLSNDAFILAWLASGILLIFGFFLLPQVGVHRIMAFEKRQRLMSFTNHLEEAMERSLREPTSENMQRLRELFDLQAHLKGMNEWPFNTNTLWQLITALLIPVVVAVLEIFF
jgi:hypothetical protein